MQFTPPCQELAPDRKIRVGWMSMRRKSIGGSVSVMTEDERQYLLRTVAEAHVGLSEVAFKLRRELTPKAPALKRAIKAERETFHLKGELQRLDMEDLEQAKGRESLPEVRRGGKVVDVDQLLRQKV